MKQVALKNLINDLNMSGVYDSCSDSFMNITDIEKNIIINQLFKPTTLADDIEQKEDISLPSKEEISKEIDFLFSSFNKPSNISKDLEVFSKKPEETFKKRKKIVNKSEKTVKPVENKTSINPEDFITIKKSTSEESKIAIVIPYESENTLKKAKDEFNLMQNILKTMGYNFSNISCIFVNPGYKNAFQKDSDFKNILAKHMVKNVECLSENIIFLFGKDLLKITNDENYPSENYGKMKNLDKNILANYSLSAMLNNRKYKALTWENILSIKDQLNK